MTTPESQRSGPEISGRLQALMLLRVIFVSLLLGASIFIQIRQTQTYFAYIQNAHYLLIILVYFLTFIYTILFKHLGNLVALAYLQLIIDTLLVTAIIYTTGGIGSIFSFLYIIAIIIGSMLLYRKGGFIIASTSSILYGLLLDLHYYDVIHPLGTRSVSPLEYLNFNLFYLILVNIVAFYLVAYLSGYLSEQIRESRVELKEKQVDIDKLEFLNRSIINSITSGLIALNDDDTVILFNPAAESMFGMRADEVIGKDVMKVLPFLSQGGLRKPDQGILRPFSDIPYMQENGEKVHLRLSTSPLRLPIRNRRGHILVFQDVTQIKQIEEDMKKVEGLAMIGEMAAGIAHEIRNPMASISGSIQMLRDDLDSDDVNSRLMDIILRETSRLNHLINDFLLFARPKKANMSRFDINQLILEALELFCNSRHWTERMTVVKELHYPLEIESDPEQVRQVLWNLFLNASEAMEDQGTLHVTTDVVKDSFRGGRTLVEIVVRDTGPGFPPYAISQLFTPFFTTKEGGSGLGLATVKRLVEGLSGKVSGRNNREGGAELTIHLPMAIVAR